MPFALKLDPAESVLFTEKNLPGPGKGLSVTLKITNPLPERISFKVKCTSNALFRIRPPSGLLNRNESIDISVRSFPSIPARFQLSCCAPRISRASHYFVVTFVKAADERKDPVKAWAQAKLQPNAVKRMAVVFNCPGDLWRRDVQSKETTVKTEEHKDGGVDDKDVLASPEDKKTSPSPARPNERKDPPMKAAKVEKKEGKPTLSRDDDKPKKVCKNEEKSEAKKDGVGSAKIFSARFQEDEKECSCC